MFETVADFRNAVDNLTVIHDAYDIFEDQCTDALRREIYQMASPSDPEPFRSAMHRMGYTEY